MDIQLTKVDPITGVVSLGIPDVPRRLLGLDKLTQLVALYILKNPGQDVLIPGEGTGFRDMIGQYNFSNTDELRSEVTQRIATIEAELLAIQPMDAPASERLKKLSVQDVAYDELTRGLLVRVRIINEADAESDVIV